MSDKVILTVKDATGIHKMETVKLKSDSTFRSIDIRDNKLLVGYDKWVQSIDIFSKEILQTFSVSGCI